MTSYSVRAVETTQNVLLLQIVYFNDPTKSLEIARDIQT